MHALREDLVPKTVDPTIEKNTEKYTCFVYLATDRGGGLGGPPALAA